MKVTITENKTIEVEDEVVEFLKQQGEDFRISTSCYGPILIPISMKSPKDSDIQIKCGDRILYISRVQASYIHRIDKSMLVGFENYTLGK
jgi:hypothetical protein